MAIKYPASIEKTGELSRIMRAAFIFLILFEFTRAVITLIVFFSGNGGYRLTENFYSFSFIYFSNGSEFSQPDVFVPFKDFTAVAKILFLLGVIPVFCLSLKNLYHLQRLFYYYEKGKIFTSEVSGQIRRVGSIFCWLALFSMLSELFQRNAVMLSLSGSISGIQLYLESWAKVVSFVLIGAIIICISWIMETGREMREDRELAI